jgi:hypothetical protein
LQKNPSSSDPGFMYLIAIKRQSGNRNEIRSVSETFQCQNQNPLNPESNTEVGIREVPVRLLGRPVLRQVTCGSAVFNVRTAHAAQQLHSQRMSCNYIPSRRLIPEPLLSYHGANLDHHGQCAAERAEAGKSTYIHMYGQLSDDWSSCPAERPTMQPMNRLQ